jgi:hypothetical protein
LAAGGLARPLPDADLSDEQKNTTRERRPRLKREQRQVYQQALRSLNQNDIPYAVGAAFARHAYTNIWRHTKDLDIFLRPKDLKAALDALKESGFELELKDPHWLAKAWKENYFIDLIFGTGHGHIPVDDDYFIGSVDAFVLDIPTRLIPLEEMIASACFIVGRNRFDGGEIAHLVRYSKGKLDWRRILKRLGENRELLLMQLIHFDFVYPGHSNYLPIDVMVELFDEARTRWENQNHNTHLFRGTLIDPFSYNVDVIDWGYQDRRKTAPLVNQKGEVL